MALSFNTNYSGNGNFEAVASEGTLDNLTIMATTEPDTQTALLMAFYKQSEFIVQCAFYMEWATEGADVTELRFPFPYELISPNNFELLPSVAEGQPAITEDTDLCPPQRASFYYTQTDFVEGSVVLGLRDGFPVFILTPDVPVNLIKVSTKLEWLKTILRVIYE